MLVCVYDVYCCIFLLRRWNIERQWPRCPGLVTSTGHTTFQKYQVRPNYYPVGEKSSANEKVRIHEIDSTRTNHGQLCTVSGSFCSLDNAVSAHDMISPWHSRWAASWHVSHQTGTCHTCWCCHEADFCQRSLINKSLIISAYRLNFWNNQAAPWN